MMSWISVLATTLVSAWMARKTIATKATITLLLAATAVFFIAVFVGMQACHCSYVMAAVREPDARTGMLMAVGFALASGIHALRAIAKPKLK